MRVPPGFAARLFLLAAVVGVGAPLSAQPDAPTPTVAVTARFEASQLDELLGPVALYPDALIALILPASTAPSDIVLSARFIRDGGDVAQADTQPWDDSVRALARYPDVVKWMDDNLAWTKQLGEAFTAQPADVMDAVQRLRAKARAAGNLTDTPQQQIVVASNTIAIVPAQPDVIYVPYYDPQIVYVTSPDPFYSYSRPVFGFSRGYSTGFWLSYNLDWSSHRVWCVDRGDRQRHWLEHRTTWHRPTYFAQPGYAARVPNYYRTWSPRSGYAAARPTTNVRASVTVAVARPSHIDRPSTRYERRDAGAPASSYRSGQAPSHTPVTRFANPLPQSMANPLPQPLAAPLPERDRSRPSFRQSPAPAPAPSPNTGSAAPAPTPERPRYERRDNDNRDHAYRPRTDNRPSPSTNPAPAPGQRRSFNPVAAPMPSVSVQAAPIMSAPSAPRGVPPSASLRPSPTQSHRPVPAAETSATSSNDERTNDRGSSDNRSSSSQGNGYRRGASSR